jgi:hypothetical protein
MQHLTQALIVASFATVILVGRTMIEPPRVAEPQPTPAPTVTRAPAIYATVVKPFGAAIRVAPSQEAASLFNVACGEVMQALLIERGWVKVRTEVGVGWIGASRVAVANGPASVDCSGHRFLYPPGAAWTLVHSGCLGLRVRPSEDADEIACVGNGHIFSMVDGPFDPGSGGDWFRVSSPTTGTGWVPAETLYPL